MSMEAFISGRSVISSAGDVRLASPTDQRENEERIANLSSSSGSSMNYDGNASGHSLNDDGESNIVLAERTSQLMSSYRNYISKADDEEALMGRIYSEGGSGGNTVRPRHRAVPRSPGKSDGSQVRDASRRGCEELSDRPGLGDAPLLREWNFNSSNSNITSRCELEAEDLLWDGGYDADADCARKYRYAHPIYGSKKFKKFLLAFIVVGAIVGAAVVGGRKEKENELNKLEEEIVKAVEVQDDKKGGKNGGTGSSADGDWPHFTVGIESAKAKVQKGEEGEEGEPQHDEMSVNNFDLPHFEIMPQEDAQEVAKNVDNPEAMIQDVLQKPKGGGETNQKQKADVTMGPKGETKTEQPQTKEEELKVEELTELANPPAVVPEARPNEQNVNSQPKPPNHVDNISIAGDAESDTRHILCCSSSPTPPKLSNRNAQSGATNEAAAMYAKAEAYHPIWYNRESGWTGTTYEEGLDFCTSQSEQGGEGFKQLCPYEAYCPTGANHMPLGGYRMDDGDKGGGNGETSEGRSPIADYENGWVQVGSADACVQYTIFDEEGGKDNGEDKAESSTDSVVLEVGHQTIKESPALAPPSSAAEGFASKAERPQPQAPQNRPQQQLSLQDEIDLTLHSRYKPLWLSSREGWNSGSHADAAAFCASVRGKQLCPYAVMCPHGVGGLVMGGRHHSVFEVKGEQYAPVAGGTNHWVLVGDIGDDGESRCKSHRQLEGRPPEWGLNAERAEIKRHIMCCTVN